VLDLGEAAALGTDIQKTKAPGNPEALFGAGDPIRTGDPQLGKVNPTSGDMQRFQGLTQQ